LSERTYQPVWLNRQADQIERTLTGMSMPVRVSGGHICDGRVRYHLTPLGGTRIDALERRGVELALELGAERVTMAPETGGMSLDIPAPHDPPLRLLPLMRAMGDLPARTAVIGMTDSAGPLTLCLDDAGSQHLWVSGPPACGKSELLRSLLLSLALTSRPSQLQLLAVDPGGGQLVCVEALPHALTDLAAGPGFAVELLEWLAMEVVRRVEQGIRQPALAAFVDGIDRLPDRQARTAQQAVRRCVELGGPVGVHLLVSAGGDDAEVMSGSGRPGLCRAQSAGSPGRFEFTVDRKTLAGTVAWVPAVELAEAVALAQRRPAAWAAPRPSAELRWGQL
jgi:hypothetical protein